MNSMDILRSCAERLYRVLAGDAPVLAAMLSGTTAVAVLHPLVADIDDEALAYELRRLTRRLFGAAEPVSEI